MRVPEDQKILPLTSLRFFAAMTVVLGHAFGVFPFGNSIFKLFPASQGVTFFFVLSGFILTYSYPALPTWTEKKRFLVARFARIWPMHVTALLFCVLLLIDMKTLFQSPTSIILTILNVGLLHGWIPMLGVQFSFNAVSWSISVELFFYISFIFLIYYININYLIFLGALGPIFMIFISLLYKPVVYDEGITISTVAMIYTYPLARIFEFTLGMSMAIVFAQKKIACMPWFLRHATKLEIITVVSCIVLVTFVTKIWIPTKSTGISIPIAYWLEYSSTSILFVILIFVFAFSSGAISRLLSHPFFVMLGEISFCIYLLHQIIYRWVQTNPQIFAAIHPAGVFALYLAATFGLSWLFWRIVERPARTAIMAYYDARQIKLG